MKSACDFLRKTAVSLMFAGISAFIGGAAWANGVTGSANLDYFELSAEQLFSAEVTSVTKSAQSVLKSPAAIHVISNEDIIRSGATSIPEVLRMAPGVHVARIDNSTWAIGIRGFNQALSNKLLVLMDGRTLYNPLFSGVYWDAQDYLLEDIDRIEVIRGPGAALWGANAVNGVINIITKKAEDTQGTLVTAGFGNEERFFTSGRYGGELQNGKGHYRVYGKYFDRDEQLAVGGGPASDAWQAYRSGFRLDLDALANPNDRLTVQGDIYRSDADHFTNIPSFTPGAAAASETIRSEGWNLLANWKRRLSDDSALTLISYLDYAERNQRLVTDERISFDADLLYELSQMGRHKVIVGGRYRYSEDDLKGSAAVTFNPASRSDNLFSAFIQDQITLRPETWYLTLGSKFDHNDYTGFEIQPNARLQWHPDADQTLWAAVSRAVRTPSRLEHNLDLTTGVFTSPVPFQLLLVGNPGFNSEDMIAYELGYRKQLTDDMVLDTTVFYNTYNDLSSFSVQPTYFAPADAFGPARTVVPVIATNNMTGEVYGWETVLDWHVRDNWKLGLSYSLMDAQLHSSGTFLLGAPVSTEGDENEAPHHMFNIQSLWNITDNVSYDTFLYYVDSIKGYGVDDHLRLDMRLGWKINESMHVNLIGQNLLDDAHREFGNAPDIDGTEIERSIFAKVVWQF